MAEREHFCDSAESIDLCLNCNEPVCVGDCLARRMADRKQTCATTQTGVPCAPRSEREKQYVVLYEAGLDDVRSAFVLGLAKSTVQKMRTDLGLPANRRKREPVTKEVFA